MNTVKQCPICCSFTWGPPLWGTAECQSQANSKDEELAALVLLLVLITALLGNSDRDEGPPCASILWHLLWVRPSAARRCPPPGPGLAHRRERAACGQQGWSQTGPESPEWENLTYPGLGCIGGPDKYYLWLHMLQIQQDLVQLSHCQVLQVLARTGLLCHPSCPPCKSKGALQINEAQCILSLKKFWEFLEPLIYFYNCY